MYVEPSAGTTYGGPGSLARPKARQRENGTGRAEYLTVLRYQATLALSDPGARNPGPGALADSRGDSVPVLVSLGDALLAGGREDEASVLWERALRSTPRTVFSGTTRRDRHRNRATGIACARSCASYAPISVASRQPAAARRATASRRQRHGPGQRVNSSAAEPRECATAAASTLGGRWHRRPRRLEQAVMATLGQRLAPYLWRVCERTPASGVGTARSVAVRTRTVRKSNWAVR